MPSKRRKASPTSQIKQGAKRWARHAAHPLPTLTYSPAQEHVSVSNAREESNAAFERHLLWPFRDSFDSPNGHTNCCPCDKMRLANTLIRMAYRSGHREGWEPGPSTDETMSRLHDWIRNEKLGSGQPDPWKVITDLRKERQEMRTLLEEMLQAYTQRDWVSSGWVKRVREVLK